MQLHIRIMLSFPSDKYCYRQAEIGVGDCGGLRFLPGEYSLSLLHATYVHRYP